MTLATGTTMFTNLPDIPLTDLRVTLTGGSAAAFPATCNPAVGTATSVLTTQNAIAAPDCRHRSPWPTARPAPTDPEVRVTAATGAACTLAGRPGRDGPG